jgi:hypothetical protein
MIENKGALSQARLRLETSVSGLLGLTQTSELETETCYQLESLAGKKVVAKLGITEEELESKLDVKLNSGILSFPKLEEYIPELSEYCSRPYNKYGPCQSLQKILFYGANLKHSGNHYLSYWLRPIIPGDSNDHIRSIMKDKSKDEINFVCKKFEKLYRDIGQS